MRPSNPPPDVCTDVDGDGQYASCRLTTPPVVDCDDMDAERKAGLVEVCNGIDDDCNGVVDDGAGAPACALSCAMPASGCESLTKLVAGDNHACALTEQGRVVCWGSTGALATSPMAVDRTWTYVPGIEGAKDIDAEGSRTCVRKGTQAICWDATLLIPTAFEIGAELPIALTRQALCVRERGTVCWRFDEGPAEPSADSVATSYFEVPDTIAAGASLVCGLNTTNGLECVDTSKDPAEWQSTRTSTADVISVGQRICAIEKNPAGVRCWDANGVPTIPGTADVVEIASGSGIECGRTSAGKAWCWTGPDPVETTMFKQIATGKGFGCGITSAGDVQCWGSLAGNPVAQAEVYQKGPVLHAGGAPLGKCDTAADLKVLWTKPLTANLDTCSDQCGGSTSATCEQQCLVQARSLTADCAACFATYGRCEGDEATCQAALEACAGFDANHYTSRTM
ncbi:MAG: MopE-related protein [Myxococcales bacterium]